MNYSIIFTEISFSPETSNLNKLYYFMFCYSFGNTNTNSRPASAKSQQSIQDYPGLKPMSRSGSRNSAITSRGATPDKEKSVSVYCIFSIYVKNLSIRHKLSVSLTAILFALDWLVCFWYICWLLHIQKCQKFLEITCKHGFCKQKYSKNKNKKLPSRLIF